MQYHQGFDIGFYSIVNDVEAVKRLHKNTLHRGPFFIPPQYYRQDLVDFLIAHDITVYKMILIELGAEGPDPHCDDPGPGPWARLVWWESDQTDMIWYKLKSNENLTMMTRSVDGVANFSAREQQVDEIFRVRLASHRPAIVRTGVLHSGENHGSAPWAPHTWGWQIFPHRNDRAMTGSELAESLKQYLRD